MQWSSKTFLILLTMQCLLLQAQLPEKPFVIIVPSYKNAQWYKKNLDSIFSQKYTNYRVIYIDDQSPDNTGNLVEQYLKERHLEHKCLLIKNNERRHAMANRYRAIHLCESSEIVINVDGDDWLATDHALAYLNRIYQNPNVWMTYGQFIRYPSNLPGHGHEIPKSIIKKNAFRTYGAIPTFLYSFYAGLFHKIKKEDLMYKGQFLQMAHSAFMFPIIEMAGNHSCFVAKPLYVHNEDNPINDHKIDKNLQQFLSAHVKAKSPYKPVQSIV